jgi:hypothetical protein
LFRESAEGLGADERGTHRRKQSLAGLGELTVNVFGHDQADHCVAQKFQPFVRGKWETRILVQKGPMNQRLLEEGRVPKRDFDDCLGSFEDFRPALAS